MRIPSSSASRSAPDCGGAARRKKAGTPTPCCSKVGLKRGPWTAEEDEVLSTFIRREGEGRWRTLPTRAGLLRCGKSCRLRWMNYLRPSVKRGHIAPDEEDLILRLHRLLGNRWSLIAGRIPGRTDNEIKNYWNTHLSKKLISQGIDPRTHKPLSPSNPNSSNIAAAAAVTPPHHEPSSSSTPSISTNLNSSPIDAAVLSSDHLPPSTPPFLDVALEYFNCPVLQDPGESPEPAGTDMVGFNRELEEEYCDISRGCADDAFSSFLNSLIKEDELVSAKYLQPDEQHDVDDALLASTKGDALAMGMISSSSARKAAATALSSSSAFIVDNRCEQNDPTN